MPKKLFRPGQSGNPGGRPKGLARRVRDLLNDGDDLVQFFIRVYTDTDQETKWTRRDRLDAAKWLADRGWGKPAQPVTGEGGTGPVSVTANLRLVRTVAQQANDEGDGD